MGFTELKGTNHGSELEAVSASDTLSVAPFCGSYNICIMNPATGGHKQLYERASGCLSGSMLASWRQRAIPEQTLLCLSATASQGEGGGLGT